MSMPSRRHALIVCLLALLQPLAAFVVAPRWSTVRRKNELRVLPEALPMVGNVAQEAAVQQLHAFPLQDEDVRNFVIKMLSFGYENDPRYASWAANVWFFLSGLAFWESGYQMGVEATKSDIIRGKLSEKKIIKEAEEKSAKMDAQQKAVRNAKQQSAPTKKGAAPKLMPEPEPVPLMMADVGLNGQNINGDIANGATAPTDLTNLTVPVLKDMLRERGLKVSGKKAELIERLR